jgi:hypothetical protein
MTTLLRGQVRVEEAAVAASTEAFINVFLKAGGDVAGTINAAGSGERLSSEESSGQQQRPQQHSGCSINDAHLLPMGCHH